MLIVVDAFSRYCFAEPMQNRSLPEVLRATRLVLTELRPKLDRSTFMSDLERSFVSSQFGKLLQEFGLKQSFTYSPTKLSPVERCIRTLRSRLNRLIAHKRSTSYNDDLRAIVSSYNRMKHSIIKQRPADVYNDKRVAMRVLDHLYPHVARGRVPYISHLPRNFPKIGSFVRVLVKKKNPFAKENDPTRPAFSSVVYQVIGHNFTRYPSARLRLLAIGEKRPEKRAYYADEVTPVNWSRDQLYDVEKVLGNRVVDGVKQLLIKWKGYRKPTWESAANVFTNPRYD